MQQIQIRQLFTNLKNSTTCYMSIVLSTVDSGLTDLYKSWTLKKFKLMSGI